MHETGDWVIKFFFKLSHLAHMSDTSFGLGTCYHLERLISIDQQFFEDDISLTVDRFPSIKCLSITKNLVNAKLLVADQLLADGKL